MKRNDFVQSLINLGLETLSQEETNRQNAEQQRLYLAAVKWEGMLEKARRFFDASIRDAIEIHEHFKYDIQDPPALANAYFVINVDDCAPILLRFLVENGNPVKAIFVSPRIDEDEEKCWDKSLIWSYGTYGGIFGTMSFETESIDLALADAERKYLLMQDIYNQRRYSKSEKQLKYENMDGSEPVPDLVLLEGIRRMIREEITRLNA